MSALAGYWGFGEPGEPVRHCERILAAQAIYGSGAVNLSSAGEVALGRNLFQLLPEDRFDRQPLIGGGGRFTLVADVRLDDRNDLARALGLNATELADSDLILAAWERWGHDAFDHLYGDYAFAIWDSVERELILARDALGGRPLHYHRARDFIAFASMPKGLHALEAVPRSPDDARTLQFLALMPESGPRSFFEGVSRVELGQIVTLRPDGVSARFHWNPRRRNLPLPNFEACVEAARHELDRAVTNRLRGAEGHVGAHLSGGFDSSGVAGTAARLLAPTGGRVTAFTAVPREGYDLPTRSGTFGDEGLLARETADLHANIDHILVRPDGSTILDQLDRDCHLFERPLANADVWQFWNRINAVGQQRGLRVILNGGFGNITLSYNGLPWLAELAGRGRLLRLAREGRALVRQGYSRWSGVMGIAFGSRIPAPLWDALMRARGYQAKSLATGTVIRPDRLAGLHALAAETGMDFHYRPTRRGFAERVRTTRVIDFGNNRKGALAGWGIDMRDPTSDRRLIEFCLSVPDEFYLRDGVPRALARGALADRVAASVLGERRRGAQAADLHEELTADRERLRDEVDRLARVPSAAAMLDLDRMRTLIADWPTGGWHTERVRNAYSRALLRGVVVGRFLSRASGGGA